MHSRVWTCFLGCFGNLLEKRLLFPLTCLKVGEFDLLALLPVGATISLPFLTPPHHASNLSFFNCIGQPMPITPSHYTRELGVPHVLASFRTPFQFTDIAFFKPRCRLKFSENPRVGDFDCIGSPKCCNLLSTNVQSPPSFIAKFPSARESFYCGLDFIVDL